MAIIVQDIISDKSLLQTHSLDDNETNQLKEELQRFTKAVTHSDGSASSPFSLSDSLRVLIFKIICCIVDQR